jgi:NAD(P)-dependent dehydrogenase (short-subunit alcohol dehydrogenase family)
MLRRTVPAPRRGPVLVTGVSSGIGLATALHLAERGFPTIGAVRDAASVEDVERAASRAGVRIDPVVLDVADQQACADAVAGMELYGLVNNAGFYNVGAVEDVAVEDARRQFETMVLGPMQLARHALPGMRNRGGGRIVNVSTSMVHLSFALTGWYQASNHALSAVGDALRMEVASSGVAVIAIEPGAIETQIWRKAEQDLLRQRSDSGYAPAYDRALRILHALDGRIHPPELVAEAIGTALTARRPQIRYQVGREVWLLRAAGVVVPRRVRDLAVRTVLSL